MELIVDGIVISSTPIKEKDAMVNLLTKNGRVGFFARSIMSLNSKNASSCLLFSHSSFTLSSKGESLSLKKGEIITSNYKLYESIETMTCLQFMSEMTLKLLDEDEGSTYEYFLKILELLNEGFDSLTLITIYLAKLIKLSGYSINYSNCVECSSKKNIVSLDYNVGGFICNKCASKFNLRKKEDEYLKIIRYIFMVDIDNFNKVILNRTLCKKILKELLDYIKERYSFKKWNGEELYFSTIK